MKTSSCKAKGRGLQQKVRDMYRSVGIYLGLTDGDIESIGMGQKGVDIVFSPYAKGVFNHLIECKKHKRVVVPTLFKEHYEKYKDVPGLKLMFHENDRSDTLVTMRAEDFIELVAKSLDVERLK